MKEVPMKKVLFVLMAFLFTTGVALATPIYNGDTYADFGTGGLPTGAEGPGYYIWSNNTARTSWSVRWTGRDWTTGEHASYDWGGQIIFSNSNGLYTPIEVAWESNDGDITLIDRDGFGSDVILFGTASAGPHWDGFDFTLTGAPGDYLTFSLDSTFFTTENDGIYIGQGFYSILNYSDSLEYFISGDGTNRQFEVAAPVPEPGTIILLGVGLAGMAGVSRKRFLKKQQ